MFYAIGYQKTEESKSKIFIALKEVKARKKYNELKSKCFRVCLLKYGSTKDDHITLAQAENGEEVAIQCEIQE